MNALEARGLSFARPGRDKIFSNLSFRVRKGEKLALLGANGSGKTTLLSLLCGRLAAGAGHIFVEDRDLRAWLPREIARKLAFLPQIERLPFNYKVIEFVLMGRAPHIPTLALPGKKDEEAARAALRALGLDALAGRGAGEISGGEYQLVRIARCLAQEADILLLDEPTSLLDPANARRVARGLAALSASGKTILFATHDIALSRFLADTCLVLGKGTAPRIGSPSAVLEPVALAGAFGVDFSLSPIPTAYSDL